MTDRRGRPGRGTLVPAAVLLAAAALLALPWLLQASPPGGDLDARVRDVAGRLRCLQCQGLSVWESNAETSLQMRAEIRRMLSEGMTRRQILDHYVSRYGERVLMSPRFGGLSALAYLAPALALAGGALGLHAFLRRGRGWQRADRGRRDEAAPRRSEPPHAATPPEVEEALRAYRGEDPP